MASKDLSDSQSKAPQQRPKAAGLVVSETCDKLKRVDNYLQSIEGILMALSGKSPEYLDFSEISIALSTLIDEGRKEISQIIADLGNLTIDGQGRVLGIGIE